MRETVKQFVKVLSENLVIQEPVYEFGSLQVEGQEGYADLRVYFNRKEYVGCDMRTGTGVDRILDLHDIDLADNSVGTVLLIDTLEHVEYCRKAISEVHRILKPNGLLIVTSVMNFPIHDHPNDYWRFTPEGFSSLLSLFDYKHITYLGKDDFPHTVAAIAIKKYAKEYYNYETVNQTIERWRIEQNKKHNIRSIKRVIYKLLPCNIFSIMKNKLN